MKELKSLISTSQTHLRSTQRISDQGQPHYSVPALWAFACSVWFCWAVWQAPAYTKLCWIHVWTPRVADFQRSTTGMPKSWVFVTGRKKWRKTGLAGWSCTLWSSAYFWLFLIETFQYSLARPDLKVVWNYFEGGQLGGGPSHDKTLLWTILTRLNGKPFRQLWE